MAEKTRKIQSKVSSEIFDLPQNLQKFESKFEQIIRLACERVKLIDILINLVFIEEDVLKQMHADYLDDDSYTDVMTFDLGQDENSYREVEIYISHQQAIENSRKFKVLPEIEITRLIIHGCLHIAGYKDGTKQERLEMKQIEDDLVSESHKYFVSGN